jgi:hypothetical protein
MITHPLRFFFAAVYLAVAATATAQPGAWLFRSNGFQFNMTLVAEVRFNGTTDTLVNNAVAVISRGQLRGMATPVREFGKLLYYVSMNANTYQGDTLQFLAYRGKNGKVYRSTQQVVFKHNTLVGSWTTPLVLDFNLNNKPLIYSNASALYVENTCSEVIDVQGSDKESSEGSGLSFSIIGGDDASKFAINQATGVLTWKNFVPDVQSPADANTDNVYEVRIRLTDEANNTTDQNLQVTVVGSLGIASVTCPDNQTLRTNDDGLGDCSTAAPRTGVPLPAYCAYSQLSYQLTGANIGTGTGLVPFTTPFAKGVTTVSYTFSGTNPASTCSFQVKVTDEEVPTISCPANKTVPATKVDPCAAVVMGINATANDNCEPPALTHTITGATTGSGSGQASGKTFNTGVNTIQYTVTDAVAKKSTCSFQLIVEPCLSFSGTIKWETNQTLGVKDVNVVLGGNASSSSVTGANGNFFIEVTNSSGSFTLKPTKNLNKLNGVTASDALAIQQHVTGVKRITNLYKLVAADVNQNNSVTVQDASLITQSLNGNQTALSQFLTSWRFVPQAHVMTNPPWNFPEQIAYTNINQDQDNQHFLGIKMGDVVTAFANPANFAPVEPLIWSVNDAILQSDQQYAIPFYAGEMADLAAWQFALRFDPEKFAVISIEPSGLVPLQEDDFGMSELGEGLLRTVWVQPVPVKLSESSVVFTLHVQALENNIRLSDFLHLDHDVLPGLSYRSDLMESPVELHFQQLIGISNADATGSGVQLLVNFPNPFTRQTTIPFVLPAACNASLRVFDVTGRVLAVIEGHYASGSHQVLFDFSSIDAYGVLFYSLTTPYGVETRKMVR